MKNKGVLLQLSYMVALLFILLPLYSFVDRPFWRELEGIDFDFVFSAIGLSLRCSFIAMIIVVAIGLPSGYFMARHDFKGKVYLDLLVNVPMVLPPAVIGLVLLMTFGNKGFIGRHLNALGMDISFTSTAVVIVLVFVSLPVFLKGVAEGFKSIDRGLEVTAMTLGDTPIEVFRNITFPLAKSSIITSLIMAWAKAIGEFGATMMFAGNIKGITQTLPLAIYTAMESNLNAAMLLSFMMILISIILVVTIHCLSMKKR